MSDVLPDSLRELLRRDALGISNDVCIVFQGDVGISMAHKPGNDVFRQKWTGPRFGIFASDAGSPIAFACLL